jgi:uracil phosphoribosyltransferase
MFRNKKSLLPVLYYNKLPPKVIYVLKYCKPFRVLTCVDFFQKCDCDVAIILEPMIATGGTLSAVVGIIKGWGPKKVIIISVLASREGLQQMQKEHHDVEIYVGAIDDKLTGEGYILPGLGDAGDRQFGTHGHGTQIDMTLTEDDTASAKRQKIQ